MPLPTERQPWPPPGMAARLKRYRELAAWWSGDPQALTRVYQDVPGLGPGADLPTGQPPGPRFLGSLVQGVQRRFWGAPPSPGQLRPHRLHIPLPADVAVTSADLLWSEPPTVRLGDPGGQRDNTTQRRWDTIADEAGVYATLQEAAEVAAAYGEVYLRAGWDQAVADMPLLDAITPDRVVPTWRSGRLVAATLWQDLDPVDGRVWRHVEVHERGRIAHGLYMSRDSEGLGRRMALADHPATAPFAMIVDPGDGETIKVATTSLTVEHQPNMRPDRDTGGAWGRSDYSGGVMALFDALDEVWTSWMRDIRLAKGRLVVPRAYLQSQGRGQGASFDAEREVYETIDALPSTAGGMQLQLVQFAIRVDEHSRTAAALVEQAVRGAGYSAQTFGAEGDVAVTATEVTARQTATYRTRSRKIGYTRPVVQRLVRTLLELDAEQFRTAGLEPSTPTVEWPDGVAVDPQTQAQTLALLGGARAASVRTLVQTLHPDWSDKEVDAEVARIREDEQSAAAVAGVPGGFTGHGPDGPAAGSPMPAADGPGGQQRSGTGAGQNSSGST